MKQSQTSKQLYQYYLQKYPVPDPIDKQESQSESPSSQSFKKQYETTFQELGINSVNSSRKVFHKTQISPKHQHLANKYSQNYPVTYRSEKYQQKYHQPGPENEIISEKGTSIPLVSSQQLSMEIVPKYQYDRCVWECKNWETKYNELYLKYLNLQMGVRKPEDGQVKKLKNDNQRLNEKLRYYQEKERRMKGEMERKLQNLIRRQEKELEKDCRALVEKFKLEQKINHQY